MLPCTRWIFSVHQKKIIIEFEYLWCFFLEIDVTVLLYWLRKNVCITSQSFIRALCCCLFTFSDYQYSLWGLKEGSIEWLRAKHEVHNRCAYRLQELCFRNGGIYIKLGQHIGQLVCFKQYKFFLCISWNTGRTCRLVSQNYELDETLEEHVI